MNASIDVMSLKAAARGDASAYASLVDASRNVVCSIALATVGNVTASEEIAQDVYLAAWRGLGTLRNPESFLPWLRQLTRNHSIEYLRRFGRRERKHVSEELMATVIDGASPAIDSLIAREEAAHLAEAIDELPDSVREVVVLYYREGQSAAQVASLLGIREDAVKKRLSRARVALRESLLERAGQVFKTTAPAAAFTGLAVAAALGAPSTAMAAGSRLSESALITSVGGKLLASLGGLGLGIAGGTWGLWYGIKKSIDGARDERERRELRRAGWVNAAMFGLLWAGWLTLPDFSQFWGMVLPWTIIIP